jgi:hypothetical protein
MDFMYSANLTPPSYLAVLFVAGKLAVRRHVLT